MCFCTSPKRQVVIFWIKKEVWTCGVASKNVQYNILHSTFIVRLGSTNNITVWTRHVEFVESSLCVSQWFLHWDDISKISTTWFPLPQKYEYLLTIRYIFGDYSPHSTLEWGSSMDIFTQQEFTYRTAQPCGIDPKMLSALPLPSATDYTCTFTFHPPLLKCISGFASPSRSCLPIKSQWGIIFV